jgi:hypothetical protein
MNICEFVYHLGSVVNMLGIYEGTYWDVILMEDKICRIAEKNSWLNRL